MSRNVLKRYNKRLSSVITNLMTVHNVLLGNFTRTSETRTVLTMAVMMFCSLDNYIISTRKLINR